MYSTPSGTIAVALPLFTLLYAVASVSDQSWSIGGSGCGLFQCCSASSGTCTAITSAGYSSANRSRSQATGAFLLLAILTLFVHVPVAFIAGKSNWTSKFGSVSVVASIVEMVLLWLSLFIAVGAPGSGYGSGGAVNLMNASLCATAGFFFAQFVREKHAGQAPAAETGPDGEIAKSSALLSVGGYANPVHTGAAAVPSPYQPAPAPQAGYQGYNAYAPQGDHQPYTYNAPQ